MNVLRPAPERAGVSAFTGHYRHGKRPRTLFSASGVKKYGNDEEGGKFPLSGANRRLPAQGDRS